jgi:hypothetical protein
MDLKQAQSTSTCQARPGCGPGVVNQESRATAAATLGRSSKADRQGNAPICIAIRTLILSSKRHRAVLFNRAVRTLDTRSSAEFPVIDNNTQRGA